MCFLRQVHFGQLLLEVRVLVVLRSSPLLGAEDAYIDALVGFCMFWLELFPQIESIDDSTGHKVLESFVEMMKQCLGPFRREPNLHIIIARSLYHFFKCPLF